MVADPVLIYTDPDPTFEKKPDPDLTKFGPNTIYPTHFTNDIEVNTIDISINTIL